MARRGPSICNLLIPVDKPVGMTSHDVVSRVRRALHERRVGHAGTLDPAASGVMVVGVGQATRLLGRLTQDRKRYLARVAFGFETTTDDAEGERTGEAPVPASACDEAFARRLLQQMTGPQMQVPPAYSAISVDGVRSYRRARAGEDFELAARPIEVFAADLVAIDATDPAAPVWTVSFEVSKGTYVRALARDIGRSLGSAAHLDALVRTQAGAVPLGACLKLDQVDETRARAHALDPVRLLGLPAGTLAPSALTRASHGAPVPFDAVAPRDAMADEGYEGRIALVGDARLHAIARKEGGTCFMEDVFVPGIEGVA